MQCIVYDKKQVNDDVWFIGVTAYVFYETKLMVCMAM